VGDESPGPGPGEGQGRPGGEVGVQGPRPRREREGREDALNKLGAEGWDLAGAAGEVSARPVLQGSGRISTRVRVVLKRSKR
jgi:hypothetical protein